jgi:hypothetical protein
MNNNRLVEAHQITSGHTRWILAMARKKYEVGSWRIGTPPSLPNDQAQELVQLMLDWMIQRQFMTKGQLFDSIEISYNKVLTYGWIHQFMERHRDVIYDATVRPQEETRLQIIRVFLNQHLELIKQQIVGVNSPLIYNIDGTGCCDWEE